MSIESHFIRRGRGCAAAVLPAVFLLAFLAADVRTIAAPVSREQALEAAYAWLSLSPEAMHQAHGQLAGTVLPVRDALGETEYYAVDLAPKGFVIVAADDWIEPVIAFSTSDVFQATPGHPLFEMLRADVPARFSRARAGGAGAAKLRGKWRMLRTIANAPKVLTQQTAPVYSADAPSASGVSDVRVAPLVKSDWDQLTSYGLPVYNYYTPPHGAGNPNNYCTGCVATMLGQIMRFHQWPQNGVGTGSYQVTVNNSTQLRALRGGDGSGGSYFWENMPLTPSVGMPPGQQQAIGALLADAGAASNMDYEPSGSAAAIKATVLTNVFQYANASYSSGQLSNLETAIEANLDAGLPVGLGINGGGMGHAVVADGYGYNAATLYHHLNMGWSGACNAWYNLPQVRAGGYDFTVVQGALFNIDPVVKGEIVSGRIIDDAGKPMAGLQVTIDSGSVLVTATTNATGIYAVKGLASNTTWTITPDAESMGFTPASLSVTTGRSSSNGGMGDKTGEDFTSQLLTGAVSVQINAGAAITGAQWRVDHGAWQASGATLSGVPIGMRTLSFRAAKGWVAPGNQEVAVAVSQTASAEAIFTPQYSLIAVPDNAADGQVSANPAPGSLGSYAPNSSVTLTATAAIGYYFAGWVENGMVASTDATYTSVVKGARRLVANFPPVSLTGTSTQVYVTSNKAAVKINVLAQVSASGGSPVVMSVTQPADGSVAINADGTLTFTPDKGFHGSAQFGYTVGDGQGGSVTLAATISNWFASSAGTYAGLTLASELTNEISGYLKARVTCSGAFTGKLTVAGLSYSLSGAFDGNGNYHKVIKRNGASNLNLVLHLAAASEILGTIGDGVTLSDVVAERVTFAANGNNGSNVAQAGKYTALLSGNDTVPGNGYLVVRISPSGGATVLGRLADGTLVSTGAYLDADGNMPYYAGVYKSAAGAGSVLGTMEFQLNGSPECTGTYAWFRPASTGEYYPHGFEAVGSVTGSLLPGTEIAPQMLNDGGATIATELSGGGLTAPVNATGQLPKAGKIAWITPDAENVTLTVGALGQVKGSFTDLGTGKKRLVLGVWLARQQVGGGFFLGDSSAGALTLTGQ